MLCYIILSETPIFNLKLALQNRTYNTFDKFFDIPHLISFIPATGFKIVYLFYRSSKTLYSYFEGKVGHNEGEVIAVIRGPLFKGAPKTEELTRDKSFSFTF